ncbi:hypothetical protein [Cupriavidus campinensis]
MSQFVPTTRIKCGMPTVYQIPLDSLSILEYALLELHRSMRDLRIRANQERLAMPCRGASFNYLNGVFSGIRFGFASILSFKAGLDDYDEFQDHVMAYENEIQFLWSKYQDGAQS